MGNQTTYPVKGILAWASATLFVVFAFGLTTSFGLYAKNIEQSLHISAVTLNAASGLYILAFALMQIPAGYLIQNKNAKLIASGAVIVLLIGIFLFSSINSFFTLALANILMGVGASFSFICAAALIGNWFAMRLFPVLLGITQAVSAILSSLLHGLFVYYLTQFSWQQVIRAMGVMGIVLLVLIFLFVSNPKKTASTQNQKAPSLVDSVAVLFANRKLWISALAAALSFGTILGYASFWSITVRTQHGLNMQQAVMVTGTAFWGVGLGTPFFAWLSNRLQQRLKLTLQMSCAAVLVLLLSLYLPHYHFKSLLLIEVIMFLVGFFGSCSMLYYTLAKENMPQQYQGVVVGFVNMIVFLFNSAILIIPYLITVGAGKPSYFEYLWTLPFFIVISIMFGLQCKESFTQGEAHGR